MVVNFRAREISRGARELTRTPMLNLKKNIRYSSAISECKEYGRFMPRIRTLNYILYYV